MLNINNYFERTADIDWSAFPEALVKGHTLVEGAAGNNWNAYRTNENIKRVVDAYFTKLSDYMERQPAAPTARPAAPASAPTRKARATRTRAEPKPKAAAKPKATARPKAEGSPVELQDPEVVLIRRYAAMHGKVKTQSQILTIIHSLQKAILERRIRKSSPYAGEIARIQDQLIRLYEKMGDMAEVQIEAKSLKRYHEIAGSQTNMLSTMLLKAYVSLNGRRDVKDRAERLLARMKKAVESGKITKSDKYADKLNKAYATLAEYLERKSGTISIRQAELNGLMGLLHGATGKKKAHTHRKARRKSLW